MKSSGHRTSKRATNALTDLEPYPLNTITQGGRQIRTDTLRSEIDVKNYHNVIMDLRRQCMNGSRTNTKFYFQGTY